MTVFLIFFIANHISAEIEDLPNSWSQSYSTYDRAGTKGAGHYAIGFGINNYCIYCKNGDTLNYDQRRFDLFAGYGLFKNIDFELKFSWPTAGIVSIKYRFIDASINGALKLGVGYMKGTREKIITDYVYDFYPTLIFSSHLNKSIQFFAAPKIIYSIHTRDRQEHSNRSPRYIFQYGLGIGITFGNEFLIIPESNWLLGNNSGTSYIVNQFGLGIEFKIK